MMKKTPEKTIIQALKRTCHKLKCRATLQLGFELPIYSLRLMQLYYHCIHPRDGGSSECTLVTNFFL